MSETVSSLLASGVAMPDPGSVYIAPEVDPARIKPGVTIYPGCRITGKDTFIGPDCELGAESPVTIKDCQLGRGVKIRGGYMERTTLMDGADCGDGTHSRPGSLLEECASLAHSDGIKQTILMPYVTLGSLINFCDVLMAGGTDARNHSEVGSSYIHFNFTAHQDKATPSIVGDVPTGVLLDRAPVFLGGQGGMVGPCRVAYGVIVAAGVVLRKDATLPNHLIHGTGSIVGRVVSRPYSTIRFGDVTRIIENNLNYIGNLAALRAWYSHARTRLMARDDTSEACIKGALARIGEGLDERLKQLGKFAKKLEASVRSAMECGDDASAEPFATQRRFADEWPAVRERIAAISGESAPPPDAAIRTLEAAAAAGEGSYIDAVKSIPADSKPPVYEWLCGIVDSVRHAFPDGAGAK